MLRVRQCMIGETAWFRRLEGEYHYMGGKSLMLSTLKAMFEGRRELFRKRNIDLPIIEPA